MSLELAGPGQNSPPVHRTQRLHDRRSAYSTGSAALLMTVALPLVFFFSGCGGKAAAPSAPPPDVKVTAVVQRDVPIVSEWVATLDGYVNAQIQPQVTGYIVKQTYKEGSPVHNRAVLFEIDPRPFQALLDQAKAQLAQAQAQMGKTQLDVDRDTPLAKERAIAQSQLDNDIQANLAAKAAVQSSEAQVPQGHEDAPKDAPPLELILADGTVYPSKGRVLYTDRQVDITTGTIRVVSAFPNPKNFLRPGQFGRVRASTYTRTGALLVPQRAVVELQGSFQLAVVGSDNKVNVRMVKVGERVGSEWIIDSGVKKGDIVVVEGVQKVRDGSTVNPQLLAAVAGAD